MNAEETNHWIMVWTEVGAISTVVATVLAGIYMHLQTKIYNVQTDIFKAQSKIALYERRYAVLSAMTQVLNMFEKMDESKNFDEWLEFYMTLCQGQFLFDGELARYIAEYMTKAQKLARAYRDRHYVGGIRIRAEVNEKFELDFNIQKAWFINQYPILSEKFNPYLDFKTI